MVRFVENSLSFNQLNISRADTPCLLKNDVGEAARSTQPVTLYITVIVTPPDLYNSPSIPTEDDDPPAEATIPGRIQFPVPEPLLPLSHHQSVETGNTVPQNPEEMSPTSTKNPRIAKFALDQADESMRRIDRSNHVGRGRREDQVGDGYVGSNCGSARNSLLMYLAELTRTLSFPHSQRWPTVYF